MSEAFTKKRVGRPTKYKTEEEKKEAHRQRQRIRERKKRQLQIKRDEFGKSCYDLITKAENGEINDMTDLLSQFSEIKLHLEQQLQSSPQEVNG